MMMMGAGGSTQATPEGEFELAPVMPGSLTLVAETDRRENGTVVGGLVTYSSVGSGNRDTRDTCGGNACNTSCTGSAQCSAGNYCDTTTSSCQSTRGPS